MVAAVCAGRSQRSVAHRYGVSLLTVQRWIKRAGSQRLDRVDWEDRPSRPQVSPTRTEHEVEDLILEIRRQLRQESDLGEFGARSIHSTLKELGGSGSPLRVPSIRTIGRILLRRGAVDGRGRTRRQGPPRGWYLPQVADGSEELDEFDVVEGLKIKDGPLVEVFNGISLHGGMVGSWVSTAIIAKSARGYMIEHWEALGLPGYAQFDNDTIFQGPHQHRDVIGSVMRLCLALKVIPVFVPPREMGFQVAIENYNGLWQAKVWTRFQHASLVALQQQSARYVTAHRHRTAVRQESAPQRRVFPQPWKLDLQAPPQGTVIFLRRATAEGKVSVLGHNFAVDPNWPHRLVRCEVDLVQGRIRFYRLRRRAPEEQPLIGEVAYQVPRRGFRE